MKIADYINEKRNANLRGKKILPECDAWEFNGTLADIIRQGLAYQIRNLKEEDSKNYKFIKQWFDEYIFYFQEHHTVVLETEKDADEANLEVSGIWTIYVSQKWWDSFEKRRKKAFKLLSEEFYGLWF